MRSSPSVPIGQLQAPWALLGTVWYIREIRSSCRAIAIVILLQLGCFAIACGRINYDPLGTNDPRTDACNDDNDIPGDGCSNGQVDPGWSCTGDPSVCIFCDMAVDQQTVALYSFDDIGGQNTVADVAAGHDGMFNNGPPITVAGPVGCGEALQFDAAGPPFPFVEVPDSPDWQLSEGSISFRVQLQGTFSISEVQGIVSRDAELTDFSGHIIITRACGNHVRVRLQGTRDEQTLLCSEQPISPDTWAYVEVNFGGNQPLSMHINGIEQNGRPFTECPNSNLCGDPLSVGIDGNNNPWVFGASSSNSTNNTTDAITSPFVGLLDHLRIRNQRNDL